MKISSALLKPSVDEIRGEFSKLTHKWSLPSEFDRTHLKDQAQLEMAKIEALNSKLSLLERGLLEYSSVSLFNEVKKIKSALRSLKRSDERLASNQSRIQKIKEKRRHVDSVAA